MNVISETVRAMKQEMEKTSDGYDVLTSI